MLLEEIRSQNRATIEAVEAQGVYLGARIDALRDSLTPRIEALEGAVREHSEEIRRLAERVQRLEVRMDRVEARQNGFEDELRAVRAGLARVEAKLDTRADVDALRDLDRRVTILERRATP